jgi:exodeoxyribonuclease VII small subunit
MTTSFRDAYGVLQRHAETLRTQEEPNIDDLLTIVTESVNAYKVCKQRIDAVEEALKAALDGAGVEPVTAPPAPTSSVSRSSASTKARSSTGPAPSSAASFDDANDDVPF